MTYTEAMAKGLALLDETIPDWFNQIDLTSLDMHSCKSCVMGQLFPNDNRIRFRLCGR
jgi:hypothetical protein